MHIFCAVNCLLFCIYIRNYGYTAGKNLIDSRHVQVVWQTDSDSVRRDTWARPVHSDSDGCWYRSSAWTAL